MRISELAERVGVPTSTVRYYERIGLLGAPERTASGYRDFDDEAATRLLFVHRARRMGLSCDQVTALLPVWDGADCAAAQERVGRLIDDKITEANTRIEELQEFVVELERVRDLVDEAPAPAICRTDLTCCVPESGGFVPVELVGRTH